jgi:PAS domain S-box-containing protein
MMQTMTATRLPKVLIVDDQQRNLDALEAMLGSGDCTLVRAGSADEALIRVLQDDFAAIVLDIRMPDMNGIDLAKLIKQRKRSQHVPILFLTAHLMDQDDVLRGYGVGAVDYLTKPINAEILRSKVGVFVELYRKTHELAELNERLLQEVVERETAQLALLTANQDLERRVRERTAALARANQEVREDEERWRMAMQVAHIAAWEWHLPSGQMTWSTDPEALFGFPKGTFGRELRMFHALHPDDKAGVEEAIAISLESGVYEAEYRIVRPDGTVAWITERGRLVGNPGGQSERMVGISRDVTEERNAGEERERLLKNIGEARDEAERQSRVKDEFLATLSHELRTPMNVILGWLDILSSGKPVRDVESALGLIQRNAQLQARLIDDLLDMNRLLSGNMQLTITTVDIAGTLQASMKSLQPAAEAKDIELTLQAEGDIAVPADGRRVQQVLWNLLHNAIKFTPEGGRVVVHAERHGNEVRITVRDTGCGISPSFLPHVFERFRQEDPSMTRETSGLGLGLSIAKHLIELHSGTISASSDGIGRGSTFLVRLPVASIRRPMLPNTDEAQEAEWASRQGAGATIRSIKS